MAFERHKSGYRKYNTPRYHVLNALRTGPATIDELKRYSKDPYQAIYSLRNELNHTIEIKGGVASLVHDAQKDNRMTYPRDAHGNIVSPVKIVKKGEKPAEQSRKESDESVSWELEKPRMVRDVAKIDIEIMYEVVKRVERYIKSGNVEELEAFRKNDTLTANFAMLAWRLEGYNKGYMKEGM